MKCATCDATPPDGARFCPACGSPCAPPGPAPTETRKTVTVVFCDLVGSTALSGRLDPEILRSVVLRYFELMRRQIEAHGGTVEKFIGDAVMAVFGVPVTHEDDARRAAAAALEMCQALTELNDDLLGTVGVRLDVRIGVNTGEVVATTDAAVRQALVSGEVVNVAARLQQHAAAGQILIGPDTRQAAGAALLVEPAGPLELKGVSGPVRAWRLLAVRPDDPEVVRRFDVPFTGREDELARLRALTAGPAGEPSARLAVVSGDAGIGKTRLVRQWLDGPDGPGVRWGAGRCRAHHDQATLAPLAAALRHLLSDPAAGAALRGEPAARALGRLRRGFLPDGAALPTLGDTCAAITEVLRELAAERPVVLVLDDCQWADPALLDVADRLVAGLPHSAVLIVCVARPDAAELRPQWAPRARPDLFRLTVPALTGEQCRVLAAHLADVSAHATVAQAVERAEGNPFVLEQLVAVLGESGPADGLPLTLRALLAARIDALPPAERTTLDRASVLGRDFDEHTLGALDTTGTGAVPVRPETRAALAALARRRLVEPVSGDGAATGRHRFRSLLVHEVTYHAVPKRQRSRLHELLAARLRAEGADDAVVGGHLERAHRHRADLGLRDRHADDLRLRAARHLTAAGRTALSRADLPWSRDLLRRALDLTDPAEEEWTAAAWRLGETLLLLGEPAQGGDLLRAVLARPAGTPAAAHARLHLAALRPGAGMAAPAREARAAIAVFEAAGDDLGLARAHLRIAQRQQFLGRHRAAERLLERSVHHARRADAEPERAMALGATGISLWLGPVPATAGIARCAGLLTTHGTDRGIVRLTLNCPLAVLHALRGRFDEARACLAEAEDVARALDYAETAVVLPVFTAQVEVLAGHHGRASRLLEQAVATCREIGDIPMLAGACRDLARVLLHTGERDRARLLAEERQAAGAPPSEAADLDGVRARIAAADGHRAAAVSLADGAVAAAGRTESPVVQAIAALDRAEVHRLLGEPEPAARSAAAARSLFARKGHRVGVGWADAFLAAGGTVTGRAS